MLEPFLILKIFFSLAHRRAVQQEGLDSQLVFGQHIVVPPEQVGSDFSWLCSRSKVIFDFQVDKPTFKEVFLTIF